MTEKQSGISEASEQLSDAEKLAALHFGLWDFLDTLETKREQYREGIGDPSKSIAYSIYAELHSQVERLILEYSVDRPSPKGGSGPTWPAHDTAHLSALRIAAAKFWINYNPADRSTAPTNEEVAEYLRDRHNITNNIATAMATILRADGLAHGRRRSQES